MDRVARSRNYKRYALHNLITYAATKMGFQIKAIYRNLRKSGFLKQGCYIFSQHIHILQTLNDESFGVL
jgi:hypothetical protein